MALLSSRLWLTLLVALFLAQPLAAITIPANFTSATTVPVSEFSYNATGKALDFSLGFHPARGTNLTVVRVTGRTFINGRFSNLQHGQRVHLRYGDTVYHFIADYYGGDGNDLVLQWAFRSTHAWGGNNNGQLGDNSTTLRRSPVTVTLPAAGNLFCRLMATASD